MARGSGPISLACALSLAGCLHGTEARKDATASPGATPRATALPRLDLKATVTVLDAETGQPIPDAWVLVTAHVTTDRPAPSGDVEAVAGARSITGQDGTAWINEVQGTYYPGEPKTKLWIAVEDARARRLGERGITGLDGGSIVVASPIYGFIHQPFAVEDDPAFQGWLKKKLGKKEDYGGWLGRKVVRENLPTLFVQSKNLNKGLALTVRMRRPRDLDDWAKTISPDVFFDATWSAMSVDTGATEEDQRRLYWLFARQLDQIGIRLGKMEHVRSFAVYLREEAIKYYVGHAPNPEGQDSTIQLWLAEKALEVLPQDSVEIKEYAQSILKGVAEEGKDPRWRNHFQDPRDPSRGLPRAEPALRWAGLSEDNPRNAWDWQDAQQYYRAGDRAKAYEALGHVLRLLVNLAIPKYTRMEEVKETEFENAILAVMGSQGNQLPPEYWWTTKAPISARTPRERFEDVVRRTVAGHLEARFAAQSVTNGSVGGTHLLAAQASFPPAIGQAAGLLRDFHRLMHPPAFVRAPGDGDGHDKPRYDVSESSGDARNAPGATSDGTGSSAKGDQQAGSSDTSRLTQRLLNADRAKPRDIPKLLEKLSKGEPDERIDAINELGEAGKDAVPGLLDMVKREKGDALRLAGTALQKILQIHENQTKEVREKLAQLADKHDYWPASIAIDSLGSFESDEADDEIRKIAKNHRREDVRVDAIRRLSVTRRYERQKDSFREMLKDPSPVIRDEAAAALGFHGNKSGLETALSSLRHSKDGTQERDAAVRAVSMIGDARAIPILESIRDAEPPPEGHIVEAIAVLKFKQLRDDDARVDFLRNTFRRWEEGLDRWALVETFIRAKQSAKYKDLLKEIASDPKYPKQPDAASLLKNMKQFVQAPGDGDHKPRYDVSGSSANAKNTPGAASDGARSSEEGDQQRENSKGPRLTPSPSVTQLLDDAHGTDDTKKETARLSLRNSHPASANEVRALAQAIHDDPDLREAAVESMSHISPERSDLKGPVTELLDDKDVNVQRAAVRACRSMKANDTAPRLRKMLSRRPRFRVTVQSMGGMSLMVSELHRELASALVEFNDVEAIDEILSRDELMGFGAFGGPLIAKFGAQVLPKVVALAKKGDIRKVGALGGIGWMKDEAAVPQLAQLVDDSDADIATAATSALGGIAPKANAENRKIIEDALDKAVRSKEEGVRAAAYQAQIMNRDARAFPVTLDMILREDGVARLDIFYALMNSNRKEVVPILKEFIKLDEVRNPNWTTGRKVAAQAIFRLTGERVPYRGVDKDRVLHSDPYDPMH